MNRTLLGILVCILFFGASITTGLGSNVKNDFSTEKNKNYPFKDSSRNDWWDLNWTYRKQITINHDMVTGDLQNFPVLISTVSSDFIDHAQYDGDDFLFVSEDNSNVYNHEIEYYDSSSGNLIAWVNIPSLSSHDDTIFYLYYGNYNCSNQQNIDGVWDSDYIHVWHLGESLSDSAGSDDGNDHGTTKVSGKIGQARDFERSEGDYIDFGDMAQPADGTLTTMTWEAWIKPETQEIILMSKYKNTGTRYFSYYVSFGGGNGIFINCAYAGEGISTRSKTIDSFSVVGQWVYLTSTWTLGGTKDIDPFINGIEVSDIQDFNSAGYMKDTPIPDELGRFRLSSGTEYTDAVIDEVRWSKVVRSDAWINTSFNTMNDSNNFFNIGIEEPSNFPPSKPNFEFPVDGSTDIPIDTNLSWVCSDPEGGNVTFDIYFGISNPPPKITSNYSADTYYPGLLDYCTIYYWQIVAYDDYGQSTIGDIWQFKTVCNGPPDIPRINGPMSGKPGNTYSYTFVSEDPNGDNVFYEIDWGDGQVEPWDGPHNSNEVITRSHSWDEQGTFIISARAKDIYENIGDWGEFEVTIPRNKFLTNPFILQLLKQFLFLQRLLNILEVLTI